MAYLDRALRIYGEERLGKKKMSNVSDEQVEEARRAAFTRLREITEAYGRQEKDTIMELFCGYLCELATN